MLGTNIRSRATARQVYGMRTEWGLGKPHSELTEALLHSCAVAESLPILVSCAKTWWRQLKTEPRGQAPGDLVLLPMYL